MKKHLILLSLPFAMACGNGTKTNTPKEDSLTAENHEMRNELTGKDTVIDSKEKAISEFLKSFNEIQENLNAIKAKENTINTKSKSSELKKSEKDQIISDIQFIYDQMNRNKQKLAAVNKKLKDSNIKIEDLEKAIVNLTNQLTDKENEIADLKSQIERMNVDLSNLKTIYDLEKQDSDSKTEILNTAYYIIGSSKDLKQKGIVTKEGGFVGLGKTTELNKEFNQANFTKVDITALDEIPLNSAKKVKLITPHPESSYKLTEGATAYEKLVILDKKKFWEGSKYLVMMVTPK